MQVLAVSHLDHGLSEAQVQLIRERFADRDAFFIETFELPVGLGTVPCGLHGPLMGDEPVGDSEAVLEVRNGRDWPSRLCERAPRQVRTVTVIAGPVESAPCVLYTAFGGPLTPREPADPAIPTDKDRAESAAVWSQHALSR